MATLCHETCHMIGLINERQSSDSDDFVEIKQFTITSEIYNKDCIKRNEALLSEYDLRSINYAL